MCNSTPVAGPPIQLPLGQTLTQMKPKIAPSDDQSANPTGSGSGAPGQTSANRGNNLNLAV